MLSFFKNMFSRKSSKSSNLDSNFVAPFFFRIFLNKYIYSKSVIVSRLNKYSLVSKISRDVNKVFFYLFFFIILFYNFVYVYWLDLDDELLFLGFSLILLIFVSSFFVVNIFLLKSLDNNIVSKFDRIKKDMKKIKSGGFSQKINVNASDEINDLVFFINNLLSKLESSIECEKEKSLIDPLTSCHNRRAMNANFEYIKNKIIRDKTNMDLLLLDLDHFKKVNDRYGHNVGDKVLIEFVKIVKESLRIHDFVYRVGGEEFLIIFPNINRETSLKILDRIKKNIEQKIQKSIKELDMKITFSGGLISSNNYDLREEDVLNNMIKDADELLYKAKNKGRNRIISI